MLEINSRNIRTWSMMGQRGAALIIALSELASARKDIMVVTADLSLGSGLERYKIAFPEQFVDVGIAEQNMIGVAAGLAKEGNCVFTTTYAPFASMRCYEQIRNNLGVNEFNVKIIGFSSGVAMGAGGSCHHAIEDIAIMRSIPKMLVLSPADALETIKMIEEVSKTDRPAYIRLTGNLNCPVVYKEDFEYKIGKANILRTGERVALIAAGTMVNEAIRTSKLLEEKGISSTVVDMHTIKPIDKEVIDKLTKEHELIVTVEEHNIIGGLGSAVAEYLSTKETHTRQLFIGFNDIFPKMGDYNYLLKEYGLYAETICSRVIENLEKRA